MAAARDIHQRGAPAERAGLRGGDIVLSVNGQAIENASQFTRRVAATAPGQALSLNVLRDGASRTVTLNTALRPAETQLNGDRGGQDGSGPTTPRARPGALGLARSFGPDPPRSWSGVCDLCRVLEKQGADRARRGCGLALC